jgi:hypothetical protein
MIEMHHHYDRFDKNLVASAAAERFSYKAVAEQFHLLYANLARALPFFKNNGPK